MDRYRLKTQIEVNLKESKFMHSNKFLHLTSVFVLFHLGGIAQAGDPINKDWTQKCREISIENNVTIDECEYRDASNVIKLITKYDNHKHTLSYFSATGKLLRYYHEDGMFRDYYSADGKKLGSSELNLSSADPGKMNYKADYTNAKGSKVSGPPEGFPIHEIVDTVN